MCEHLRGDVLWPKPATKAALALMSSMKVEFCLFTYSTIKHDTMSQSINPVSPKLTKKIGCIIQNIQPILFVNPSFLLLACQVRYIATQYPLLWKIPPSHLPHLQPVYIPFPPYKQRNHQIKFSSYSLSLLGFHP